MPLDKSSSIPLYHQLAEQLRDQIATGELAAGAKLPSERELSEQSAISRMTVRQALTYLARQGLLEVRPGIGAFVAAPKISYDALHLLGFSEELLQHGQTVRSHVLEQELLPAPAHIATRLHIDRDAPIIKIKRLRFLQDAPMVLETAILPHALCPGLEHEDLSGRSLYAVLEQRYGLQLQRARQSLEVTTANDYEAPLFGIAVGAPMILLMGVTLLHTGAPIEYFKAVYRGDRFKFELESQRGHDGVPAVGNSQFLVAPKLKP